MAPRKRTVTQEPLLSTLARKLGHAAGTLTKVTQEFADNVSAGEFAGSARVVGTPGKSFPAPSGHAEPEQARQVQTQSNARHGGRRFGAKRDAAI